MFSKTIELADTAARRDVIQGEVKPGMPCALVRELNGPISVNIDTSGGRYRIGNLPASEINWISNRTDLSIQVVSKELTYAGSPWKVTIKIRSTQPIPGGLPDDDAAGPVPVDFPTSAVTQATAFQSDLQGQILSELKSINGKLTFFVILAVLSIIGSFIVAFR